MLPPRSRPGLAVLGLLLTAAGSVPAQVVSRREPQATFRSSVDLVTLHVTVTDGSGRYISDLDPQDFTVFENGRAQDVRVFEPGGLPLAVMLFLDISASMQQVFPEVQSAAIQFVQRLRPQDAASVVAFGDRVEILQAFTEDRETLERAVRQAQPHGGTRLYNALYVGLAELRTSSDKDAGVPRRRVAVLLTDGDDTRSLVSYDSVLNLTKQSDIAIYAIRLEGAEWPFDDTGEPEFVLNQLAKQTGGRAFLSVQRGSDLGPVYDEIRTELAGQYALGYVSNDSRRDGGFRHLSIQVTRPGARARTRLGYFAPLASGATYPTAN